MTFSRLCLLASVLASTASAQDRAPARTGATDTSYATAPWVWRNIGPASIGGYVSDIVAPVPRGPGEPPAGTIMYVGGPGGLFKTIDGGERWKPLLDREPAISVTSVALAPTDPNTIWVGTGDWNVPHSHHPGRGVFKSTDGGESWTSVGFERSEHVGSVAIHPTDPNTVYVGIVGPLTRPWDERGVYKTTDGGRTWARVLATGQWTGVVDLAIDPVTPTTLYAVTLQQAATSEAFIAHGPGSGIYKSTDGGATWRKLTRGLPAGSLGRSGIAVHPVHPNVVYAVIDAVDEYRARQAAGDAPADPRDNGPVAIYRSFDYGETWTKGAVTRNENGHYWGRLWTDPSDPARIYIAAAYVLVSTDSGATAKPIPNAPMADTHALWVDPTNGHHLVMGNDHGVYISQTRGRTWRHVESLTLARYWSLSADSREFFYRIYGSIQDSYGYGGPSRSRNYYGIPSGEWTHPAWGECCATDVHPADTTLGFGIDGGPFGSAAAKVDLAAQEAEDITPPGRFGEPQNTVDLRRGAIFVSRHDSRTLYLAMDRVWRSSDLGQRWVAISPRFVEPNRDSVVVMGRRYREHPRVWSDWGTVRTMIAAMAESPLDARVLYAGTRSGRLMVTRDGGRTWTEAAARPDVPAEAMVASIAPSHHAVGTAYLAIYAQDFSDSRAHIFKTTDYGAHWTRISGNLPNGAAVWSLVEHFRTPGLLFAGTDDGVYASIDDGNTWAKFGGNLPRAGRVRDLLVQRASNDLVVSVWGRGVWVLDDITPLEHWAEAARSQSTFLFPARSALLYRLRGWAFYEEPKFAAPNPPYGALLSYYVPAGTGGQRDTIEIVSRRGEVVRAFVTDTTPGLHRFAWDLRWAALGDTVRGAPVRPGKYQVRLKRPGVRDSGGGRLDVLRDPLHRLSPAAEDSLVADARFAQRIDTEVKILARVTGGLIRQLDSTRTRLAAQTGDSGLARRAAALRDTAQALLAPAYPPIASQFSADRPPPTPWNVLMFARMQLEGVDGSVEYAHSGRTRPLSPGQRGLIVAADSITRGQRRKLRAFIAEHVAAYERAVRAAGVEPTFNAEKLVQELDAPLAPVIMPAVDYVAPILHPWNTYPEP